ncbi:F-box/LRR-repeat protein 17 [Octodon degus]|uniref:F-box/LRR-repeat protein 17 n=1 Tax=Octodon degus TaxID=10160 RepID=A0A6P3ETM6_OCTDE|nr:F-box/LRR-repeat protein 17 [Octodon degus]
MGHLLSKEPRNRPSQKRPRCCSWCRRRRPLLRLPRRTPAKAPPEPAAPRSRDCFFRGPCMLCFIVHSPGAPAPAGPEEEPPLSPPPDAGCCQAPEQPAPQPLCSPPASPASESAPIEAGGDAVRAGGTAPSSAPQQHECGDANGQEPPENPCDCHREPPPEAPDINQLPPSILLKIFSNLSLDERCLSASLVCKYWRDLCLDFQFWKQLDLSSRQQVTDELLEKIASRSQNIIEINISDCRSMSDTGVCVLAFKCPGLLRYTAYRCKQLSDTSIIAVASHCPLLQKVHVGNQDKLTDEGLKQLGSKCRELKDIHFGQCYKISDEGMIVIAKGCLKLQRIYMQENKLVTDQSVKAFAEHCPELQYVGFMGCSVTSKGVIHLTKLRNLSSLDLRHITELDNETVMEIVKRCKNLSSLNLCLNWIINDRCVEVIAKEGRNLKELYLVSCKITDYALIAIGRYSMTIETVDVGWCKEITDQGATLIAQSSKSLRYLGLMRCDKVNEVTVEQLVQQYPHITFSTVLQDCKRTLERAYQMGWTPNMSAASS